MSVSLHCKSKDNRFGFLEFGCDSAVPRYQARPWFETHIAGTMYRDGIDRLFAELEPGIRLSLRREPENPYDTLAIRIETQQGEHLGYLPRRQNQAPAAWLDQGGRLEAELLSVRWRQDWLYLEIRLDRLWPMPESFAESAAF